METLKASPSDISYCLPHPSTKNILVVFATNHDYKTIFMQSAVSTPNRFLRVYSIFTSFLVSCMVSEKIHAFKLPDFTKLWGRSGQGTYSSEELLSLMFFSLCFLSNKFVGYGMGRKTYGYQSDHIRLKNFFVKYHLVISKTSQILLPVFLPLRAM